MQKLLCIGATIFAVICGMVPAVQAQTGSSKTAAQLNTEVNTLWPDNVVGSITPFNARQTLLDVVASYVNTNDPAGGDLAGTYPNPTLAWISRTAGKTLTLSNSLTLAGTDSSTLNIGTGGTLGAAAFLGSSITVNATTCTLGSSCTPPAAAGTLTGATLAAGVTGSSLTSVGTLATGTLALASLSYTGQLPLASGGSNANLTASNGGIIYSDASKMQVLAGTVTANQCLLSGSSTAPSWGSCSGAAAVTSIAGNTGAFTLSTGLTNSTNDIRLDKATSANLEAGTSNKALTADIIFDPEVTITFAASQALDFNTFLNARITATANTTSLTCSNIKASQSGAVTWVQDGTGSRTMVAGWCSQFRWAGGTRGVLSTAASAIDVLFYQCISTTVCYVSLNKAIAN